MSETRQYLQLGCVSMGCQNFHAVTFKVDCVGAGIHMDCAVCGQISNHSWLARSCDRGRWTLLSWVLNLNRISGMTLDVAETFH